MDDKYANLLIEKFWNGNASEEEKVQLYAYLTENNEDIKAEQRAAFDKLYEFSYLMQKEKEEETLKAINHEITSKVKRNINIPVSSRSVTIKKITSWAAVFIFIIASAAIVWLLADRGIEKNDNKVAVIDNDTISNTSNKIKLVTLPDKSTVLLYPESNICFEHTFQKRNIALTGKASFKVIHDAKNIFMVTTGDVVTTDIGTEFEIDALKKNDIIIRLLEGKIKVGKIASSTLAMQERFLNVGECLCINTTSGKSNLIRPVILKNETDKNVYDKRLIFNKAPLATVFRNISKKYKAKIVFDSADISGLSFSGTIEQDDSLSNILNIICYMNNLHCSSEKTGYVITR